MANVRVELRQKDGREQDFKTMLRKFNKEYGISRVAQTYKEHSIYESKSRKRRRKKKEAEINLLKNKLRENLIQSKGIKPYGGNQGGGNWHE